MLVSTWSGQIGNSKHIQGSPLKDSKIHVAYVAQVRVAPTGAEEPTMDLRKLPLGIDVADPEVGPA